MTDKSRSGSKLKRTFRRSGGGGGGKTGKESNTAMVSQENCGPGTFSEDNRPPNERVTEKNF